MPGVAVKCACVFESALTWALEAEKLDLPRLSAQCERFIVMHWEHIHKYALLIDSLSSPARRRVMMGLFHALQLFPKDTITCPSCSGGGRRYVDGTRCLACVGNGRVKHSELAIKYPSFEHFMSWRTRPGGAS